MTMTEYMVYGYSGSGLGQTTHRFKVTAANRTDAKRRISRSTLGRAWDGERISRIAATEWMPYHDSIGGVKHV